MCKEKTIAVFVYGTLKVGFKLALGTHLSSVEDTIDGTLYMFDPKAFPLAKLGTGGTIHGEVHIYPHDQLVALDIIESEGYLYNRKQVVTHGGRPVHVYEFSGSAEGLPEVEGGIWKR